MKARLSVMIIMLMLSSVLTEFADAQVAGYWLLHDDGTAVGEIWVGYNPFGLLTEEQYVRERFVFAYSVLVERVQIYLTSIETGDLSPFLQIRLRDYYTGDVATAATADFDSPMPEGWYEYDVSGASFVSQQFYVEVWGSGVAWVGIDGASDYGMGEYCGRSYDPAIPDPTPPLSDWTLITELTDGDLMIRAYVTPLDTVVQPDDFLVGVYGTTPTIDGTISPGEWDDAVSLTFDLTFGQCKVYVKQDSSSLYIAFDNDDPWYDQPEDGNTILLDVDHDGGIVPRTDDLKLCATRSGEITEYHGDDWTWTLSAGYSGWTAACTSQPDTGWQTEYSISYSKIGFAATSDKTLGVSFESCDGWTFMGYSWPLGASLIGHFQPDTWADLILVPPGFHWQPPEDPPTPHRGLQGWSASESPYAPYPSEYAILIPITTRAFGYQGTVHTSSMTYTNPDGTYTVDAGYGGVVWQYDQPFPWEEWSYYEVHFESPDLSAHSYWQNMDGYEIDFYVENAFSLDNELWIGLAVITESELYPEWDDSVECLENGGVFHKIGDVSDPEAEFGFDEWNTLSATSFNIPPGSTLERVVVIPRGNHNDISMPHSQFKLDNIHPIFSRSYVYVYVHEEGVFRVRIEAGVAKGAPISSWSEISATNIASYTVTLVDDAMAMVVEGTLQDPNLEGQLVLEVDPAGETIRYEINVAPYMFPLTPTIESCSSNGDAKDIFDVPDSVYATGIGYRPLSNYDIYVVYDVETWPSTGDSLHLSSLPAPVPPTTVTSTSTGQISAKPVWNAPLIPGKYDIIVDADDDGYYTPGFDALDNNDIQVSAGFFVIPEYPLGTILSLAMCIAALAAFKSKRIHLHL